MSVEQWTQNVARWQRQTKSGGPDVPEDEQGDCFPACIASILNVPLASLGNYFSETWWTDYQKELEPLGYYMVPWHTDINHLPTGFWLATVPSLNLVAPEGADQINHCVVARGHILAWDPSMKDRYDPVSFMQALQDGKLHDATVFLQLDPGATPTKG